MFAHQCLDTYREYHVGKSMLVACLVGSIPDLRSGLGSCFMRQSWTFQTTDVSAQRFLGDTCKYVTAVTDGHKINL